MRKIFFDEGNVLYGKFLSLQIVQNTGVCLERKAELIGVKRLPSLVIPLIYIAAAIFPVTQQRTADFRHGNANLMRSPR